MKSFLIKRIHKEAKTISWIQKHYTSNLTLLIASIASALGTHHAYLVILPPLFWISDSQDTELRIYALGLIGVVNWSNYSTGFLKDALELPRPPAPVRRKDVLHSISKEYGFPSTHTANAFGFAVFSFVLLLQRRASAGFLVPMLLSVFLFSYAVVVGLSRVLLGMHSFVDVIGGAVVGFGVSLAHLMVLDVFEHFLQSDSGLTFPISIAFLAVLSILAHPHPSDPCPCFDDSLCFVAAWTGAVLGVWHRFHYGDSKASHDFVSFYEFAIRFAIGIVTVLLARIIIKETLGIVIAGFLDTPKNQKAQKKRFRLQKFEAAVPTTRFIVYVLIGILATDLIPVYIFPLIHSTSFR